MSSPSLFRVIIASKGKKKSIEIDKDSCILGRGSNCDITIEDELISRKHLKISFENNTLTIEELGSSNGTWLDGKKIDAHKKMIFSDGSLLSLGAINGISLTIVNLAGVLQLPVAKSNSQPEKTLVYNLAQMESLKVANGANYEVPSPKSSLPKANPVAKTAPKANSIMKLVESDTPKAQDNEATVKYDHAKHASHTAESKKSFEDQVKLLVSKESENLRAASIKEATIIREKANDEKMVILKNAELQAKKIIEQAKMTGAGIVKGAENSVVLANEEIKKREESANFVMRALNETISQNEEKIKLLKNEENTHSQRIRALKEDFSTLKERIKNENSLIEDLKMQATTHRKNSELKIEEYALEERRLKAKIETEVIEARAQVAKIMAEAEKSQVQKDILEPEISQLKSDKDRLEREINEAQISFRRMEFEIERLKLEQNEAQSKTNDSIHELEQVRQQLEEQKVRHAEIEAELLQRQSDLNKKLDDLKQSSARIIDSAKKQGQVIVSEALKIREEAQIKKEEMHKELEAFKTNFYFEHAKEKELKHSTLLAEIETSRSKLQTELEKQEQRKNSTINEIKWLEENAKKKCDELLKKAQMDIEASRKILINENEKNKIRLMEEVNLQRKHCLDGNAVLKAEALKEIENMKLAAQDHCLKMKQKMQKVVADTHTEIEQEKNLIKILEKETETILKKHREALLKTESLMDENFLEAQAKVKSMLDSARDNALEIERATREKNAVELSAMTEFKRIEMGKIEEAKAQMDGYNIRSIQNNAASIADTVEDFVNREMTKSKNFMVDDKLISKMNKRVHQMVSDLLLGRYENPNITLPPQQVIGPRREIRKSILFVALVFIMAGVGYFNPELVNSARKTAHDLMIEYNITIFDQVFDLIKDFIK